jgi:pyruvate/2-oxoglutarate dehydrogenase complex dihydrolipoamide dehydrogenase (E3) component
VPIDIRLNTAVTPEMALDMDADVIVAALGGKPAMPPIPGIDGHGIVRAADAYADASLVGGRAVILGGGLAGTELGIYLASLGRSVDVLEMTGAVNDGGNFLHVKALNIEIKKYGVRMNFNTRAVKIAPSGVTAEDVQTRAERVFAADTVINALGTLPLQDEARAFYGSAPQFHMVGDCRSARNMERAVSNAYHVARDIGVY